jgi:formate dehydrogenase subunit gamma
VIERNKSPRRRGALPVVTLAPWHDSVEGAIQRHRERPGALLPILHDIQAELRHVPPDALPVIAHALNLSRAEVHGVVSFYHDFRETPSGRHMLRICRAESCQAMGANTLLEHARTTLDVDLHKTTADGEFTLEAVYCLGNCALSPAVEIDGRVFGRVTPQKLDILLDAAT